MKKNILLSVAFIVSVLGVALFHAPQTHASDIDGKTCAKYDTGFMQKCPNGVGRSDLLTQRLVIVPKDSQCFSADDASETKFACDFNTDPKDGNSVVLDIAAQRDKAIALYKQNNGGKTPTEGQIIDTINNAAIAGFPTTGDPSTGGWNNVDCDTIPDGARKTQCTAVKACAATSGYTTCQSNWDTCMQGKTSADDAKTCATTLAAANTTPQETCNITNIGWIVCPVAKLLASVTDGAYALVEKLLVFKFSDSPLSTTNNPVYTIWSNIRNLANIAFILAFFVVIFSQATSFGIGSYGIKKMLPRLIVAAILVNLSYYICVFAVDISNILGAGIDGVIRSVPIDNGGAVSSDSATASGTWTGIITALLTAGAAGAAVAAAGGVVGALAAALPFLVVALFAILTALVVLIARQALLILLIVIAPLAFVAYILPNTEEYFTKWRKLFTTLLIFYPLVALIFAGANVAASILRITSNGGGFDDQLVKVMSLAVQAFPLFALPFLLKFSGGVLGRIGGMVNNPNKGPFDGLRKRAEQTRDTAQARGKARGLRRLESLEHNDNASKFRKRLARSGFTVGGNARGVIDRERALDASKKAEHEYGQEYYTHRISKDEGYRNRMALGDANRAQQLEASAIAAMDKEFRDNVQAIQVKLQLDQPNTDQMKIGLTRALQANDSAAAAAYIGHMATAGGAGGRMGIEQVLETTAVTGEDTKKAVRNAIYRDNYSSILAGQGSLAKGGFGSGAEAGIWKPNMGGVATEVLATQSDQALFKHFDSISQSEAQAIVRNEALWSKTTSESARSLLISKAMGQTNPGSIDSNNKLIIPDLKRPTPEQLPTIEVQPGRGTGGSPTTTVVSQSTAPVVMNVPTVAANAGSVTVGYSVQNMQEMSPTQINSFVSRAGGSVSQLADDDLSKILSGVNQSTHSENQTTAFNDLKDSLSSEWLGRQRAANDSAYETYSDNIRQSEAMRTPGTVDESGRYTPPLNPGTDSDEYRRRMGDGS